MVKPVTSSANRREERTNPWTLRRVVALVLIVSGALWLIAGLAIRFLFF